MATTAARLAQCDLIIDQLQAKIAAVTLDGGPDWSLDGESQSEGAYLAQLHAALEKQIELKRKLGGPFCVRSRGRAG